MTTQPPLTVFVEFKETAITRFYASRGIVVKDVKLGRSETGPYTLSRPKPLSPYAANVSGPCGKRHNYTPRLSWLQARPPRRSATRSHGNV